MFSVVVAVACDATAATPQHATTTPAAVSTRCPLPAPTSAAGYAALWETVPDRYFAGGDLGISVRMPDGRDVWLYDDTMRPQPVGSTDRQFSAHQAALVQDRGCLRAANQGHQLVPNIDTTHIFWAHDAHATGRSTLAIRSRLIVLTGGTGMNAFADGGSWRTDVFTVTPAGDLTLRAPGRLVTAPAPDPGPVYRCNGTVVTGPHVPNHFCYSMQSHPAARLTGGLRLYTLAQNYLDGKYRNKPTWKAASAPIWIARPASGVASGR